MSDTADLAQIAIDHAREVIPCGDHTIERCAECGSTGEVHAFSWEAHIRDVMREAIDGAHASLQRNIKPDDDDRDVEGYHARLLRDVAWEFASMGGSDV